MNILFVAVEVAPFAKVGGLADVAGALPGELKALGHDVRIVMPLYRMVEDAPGVHLTELVPSFSFPVREGVRREAIVKQTTLPRPATGSQHEPVPVYLIGNPDPDLTGAPDAPINAGYFRGAVDSGHVYVYDPEVYIFFCRAVAELLERLDPTWQPDVIHCNDWHTGLLPVISRTESEHLPVAGRAATLFTIHNLAYQGDFSRADWYKTGLPEELYAVEGLEFYGRWTFMKGGLWFSDRVNTVSPSYAGEIQTGEYGCGLDGLMRTLAHEGRLSGILNGIDTSTYDPEHDPCLPARFSADHLEGKAICKTALQVELGLPSNDYAVIGMVTRLADQKGLDLIAVIAEQILDLPVQFVVLGQGVPVYERFFAELEARKPQQVHARIAFDVGLAQRIYAGCDLFLMPSRFEPCGLGQMIALRYGALPIVRATGGLADTIHDFDPNQSLEGNGFVFYDYNASVLLATVQRAVAIWQDAANRALLVQRALSSELSWRQSADRYLALYNDAINARKTEEIS